MINVNATFLIAFVFATISLLDATFLASCIIRSGEQLTTLDHLLHMATTTANGSFLGARRTIAGVTLGRTCVRIGRLATWKRTLTGGIAQWNRISAYIPRTDRNWCLTTRTRSHILR